MNDDRRSRGRMASLTALSDLEKKELPNRNHLIGAASVLQERSGLSPEPSVDQTPLDFKPTEEGENHARQPQRHAGKGTVAEHRSDSDHPHVYQAGDLSVEDNGVVHWWENSGDTTVELLAIDIFNTKQ